jgi:hypothetical protein
MLSIAPAVDDVVDEIDDSRQRTEDRERRDRDGDCRQVEQSLRKDQCSEDQEVLRPLTWPQGNEEIEDG